MKMTTVTTEWREMVVEIPLKQPGAVVEITGWVYGCWVLHRIKELKRVMWALTHIPTGRRLAVYPDTPTIEAIAPIAVRVHEAHGDKWNTQNIRKVQTMAIECKDIWQREAVTA